MYAMDAVKQAGNESGVSMYAVAKAMGVQPQSITTTAGRGSQPRANTLASMLNACGYELCAVPRDEVTEQMFVIDGKR